MEPAVGTLVTLSDIRIATGIPKDKKFILNILANVLFHRKGGGSRKIYLLDFECLESTVGKLSTAARN